jgi:hypothetical protein
MDIGAAAHVVSARTGRDISLPHLNRNETRGHYRDYFTPRLRALAEKRYEADLRLFGYAF